MKGKRWRQGLFLLFVLLLACFVAGKFHSHRSSPPEIQIVCSNFLIVRREIPVTSPAAGRLEYVVSENERVAAGQPLARIWPLLGGKGQALIVYAPRPGIVSRAVDGLETVITPDNWFTLRPEGLFSLLGRSKPRAQQGEITGEGQLLCKLVDNFSPALLVGYWPEESPPVPKPGARVLIRLQGAQKEWLQATVQQVAGRRLVISLERWPIDWVAPRYAAVEVCS